MAGTLRCAVCDYEPDELGQSNRERALRNHIQTHSLASLWKLAYKQSGITEVSA